MNDIFSFRRFWYLLRKEFVEKRVFLLGIVGVTLIIFLLAYVSADVDNEIMQYQHICLFLGIILGPAILVSYMLGGFSGKSKSIQYLTLPSSFFERWFLIFFITFFLYVPFVLLSLNFFDFYFVSDLRELALRKQFSAEVIDSKFKFIDSIINLKNGVFKGYLLVLIILTGLFTLGGLFFKKLSFYKTALLIFLVFVFIIYFRNITTAYILGEKINSNINNFGNVTVVLKNAERVYVSSSENISFLINNFVRIVLPLSLWLIAMLRFKEKEI
ncbi:hypothetical protein EGI22_19190 [Lacihabitans sp. LS3-19]|uniref:hypothetical protein n=1 Tax=Lacihabitans sp. LS3-19 TaxID=2487335 RepID=UPI0020CC7694|nr:hypothetical protein [Lacihabitans sp. LS3-19]MCP9770033.1 hypothetical protein [Lacihabitans sp. LS3-19]